MTPENTLLLWFASALGAVGFGLFLARRWQIWLVHRRMERIRKRGREGEDRAREWLEENGFRIETDQVHREGALLVDGVEQPFDVRADYLVRDPQGRRAIVEVKTGRAARPTEAATRRQVFEYAAVYGIERVYLFDATRERMMHIAFGATTRAAGAPCRGWIRPALVGWLSGLAIGGVAAWWLLRG